MRIVAVCLVVAAAVQLAYAGCSDPKGFAYCNGDKDPCALVRCKEGTRCVVDNCGGCAARCEEEGMMHIMTMPQDETPLQHVNKPGLCPDGSRPVQCLADPCKTNNRCNNATQVCQSNYCGGCNAVCKPKPKPTAGQCPDGSSFVNCLKDPCASNGPCSKDEKCLSNYCGGCNATCIKNTTNSPPNTQHQPKPADGQCAKGVEVVQCLADPCKVNNPCNPQTETCEANYCGSCSAVCRTNGKKNGTDPSNNTPKPADGQCPKGVRLVQCFANPCQVNPCKETETCEANYCGSCSAICRKKSAPEPSDDNIPPPGSKCDFPPCIATLCAANSICKNDWKSCTGICAPLDPTPKEVPNKKCGGRAPCEAIMCSLSSLCVNDWKSCKGKCVKKCSPGTGWSPRFGACRLCQLGQVTDENENVCVACPKDTYYKFDISGRKCVPCPQGSTTKGRTGQLSCVS